MTLAIERTNNEHLLQVAPTDATDKDATAAAFFGLITDQATDRSVIESIMECLRSIGPADLRITCSESDLQEHVIRMCKEYRYQRDRLAFIHEVHAACITAGHLLGSKSTSDIEAGLNFFVTATEFGIEKAKAGTISMLPLIWNEELTVRKLVMQAFKQLYCTPPETIVNRGEDVSAEPRHQAFYIVKSLSALLNDLNASDRLSLEQLISETAHESIISASSITNVLIDIIHGHGIKNVTKESIRDAVAILAMFKDSDVIMKHLQSIITVTIPVSSTLTDVDYDVFVNMLCLAHKLVPKPKRGSATDSQTRLVLPNDHDLFKLSCNVLLVASNDQQVSLSQWTSMAQVLVDVVYGLAAQPSLIALGLIRKQLQSQNVGSLVFLAGHIAIKEVCRLEDIERDIKTSSSDKKDKDKDEEGIGAAQVDDAETEHLHVLIETKIVGAGTLLGALLPTIVKLTRPTPGVSEELRNIAIACLIKYMCASKSVCEAHLRQVFTTVAKDTSSLVRSTAVIGISDLCTRFPNLLEPWTPSLFAVLTDTDPLVRRNALMVITHLVLNNLIKLRGHTAELAIILVDTAPRSRELAKLFFSELSKKDNAIYNLLPDTISSLSIACSPQATNFKLTTDQFREIMEFIISFVSKDKQMESLCDKLCARIRAAPGGIAGETDRSNFMYCLSLLPYTEKGIKILIEAYQTSIGPFLHDGDVMSSLRELISKIRKSKSELKSFIDDLERRIDNTLKCEDRPVEAAKTDAVEPAKKSSKTTRSKKKQDDDGDDEQDEQPKLKPKSRAVKTETTTKPSRSRPLSKNQPSDDEQDQDESEQESEQEEPLEKPKPQPRAKAQAKPKQVKAKAVKKQSSDDEQDDDDEPKPARRLLKVDDDDE